ncbi:MAG: dihydroorotase [Cyclobacteriaceae bacterium]|jgi:dihydroorotase
MKKYIIKGAKLTNEGQSFYADVYIKDGRIEKIGAEISLDSAVIEINGENLSLLPGVIDDQVHFREPGLTHKAEIYTEAKAAVAGGVTSYMEMPNVKPQTVTQKLLAEKYELGRVKSLANYSFFMGTTNDNYEELIKTDPKTVCGVKIFMGSSTGDMLVDDEHILSRIFANSPMLIATHCEHEQTVKRNIEIFKEKYGENIPFEAHPLIRSEEACYLSSSFASSLAKKHNTRLHILHISTGKETGLFSNEIPLGKKRITSEACIHHLWFSDQDYKEKAQWIKWNPAVKTTEDRDQIWEALLDDRIDIIATDHAPHTIDEKNNTYLNTPSGGPLVQHSLVAMLEFVHQGKISLARLVEKMCHAPAKCFDVKERGYIREGYHADLVLVNLQNPWTVSTANILAKCKWSPFDGQTFQSKVESVFVSGHLAYHQDQFDESIKGKRLGFDRE